MSESAWDIRRMMEWMEGYLFHHDDDNPRISTRWLLSYATGLTFTELYTNLDRPLSNGELDLLREGVKRRANGEPLQYITGKAPFRHIELAIREGVLIPRPETEVLVSEVLSRFPSRKYNTDDADAEKGVPSINVADLCTGSGCIACSLAYENPDIRVVATDISRVCVELAIENANAIGVSSNVDVIECNLGEGIDAQLEKSLDAVVSNPPYVPTKVLENMPMEVVGNEPKLALDGGSDGLDVFRSISKWAHGALKSDGFLAVELHETTLNKAAMIAESDGFASTKIVKDLAGKPRILLAFKEECNAGT